MTKSNMRSAGIRKHHRRIQHQANIDSRVNRERIFEQKERHRRTPEMAAAKKWYRGMVKSVRQFLGGLFRKGSAIKALNLTTHRGRHAIFGTGRDAGAVWLRMVFGQQLKMRSTRDGKPV